MANRTLSTRIRAYASTGIHAGLENIQPQVTHGHYDEDDITAPNPFVVDEIVDIIEDAEAIDTDETVNNLLSDSTEAMRRLSVIQMYANNPLERISNSTLLRADPGLESIVRVPNFTKKQLNVAIESNTMKFIKKVIEAIIKFFKDAFAKARAIFSRAKKQKPEEAIEKAKKTKETIKEDKEIVIDKEKERTMQKTMPLLLGQLKREPVKEEPKVEEPVKAPKETFAQVVGAAAAADAFASETEWTRISKLMRGCLAASTPIKELVASVPSGVAISQESFRVFSGFSDRAVQIMSNQSASSDETESAYRTLLTDIKGHTFGDTGWNDALQRIRTTGDRYRRPPPAFEMLERFEDILTIFKPLNVDDYEKTEKEIAKIENRFSELYTKMRNDKVSTVGPQSQLARTQLELLDTLTTVGYSIGWNFKNLSIIVDISSRAVSHIENIDDLLKGIVD